MFGLGEGDDDDFRLSSEFIEAVAHGDRMGCAWESMDMAMKDQDDGLAALISQHPGAAVSVNQFDRRGRLPDHFLCAHADHCGWRPVVGVRYFATVWWSCALLPV